MGKFFDNMSSMIMDAMKEGDKSKVNAYKNLKAKFIEFKTAKNAKPLDDAAEFTVMKKMVTELMNDSATFASAGRNDLAESYAKEASYIQVFLPKEASEEEVRAVIEENMSEGMTIKDMGKLIKLVKEKFDVVDGKMVADLVKNYLI